MARLLTISALAAATDVSPRKLRRWVRNGWLASERDSARRYLFDRDLALDQVSHIRERVAIEGRSAMKKR